MLGSYKYAFDNPVYFIDPDRMKPEPGITIGGTSSVYGVQEEDIAQNSSIGNSNAPDDIIFNSTDENGNKTELGRVVTDKFHAEVNIDQDIVPFKLSEDYEPFNVNLCDSEVTTSALENIGVQAFSLDISAELAFKGGVQAELSLIAIISGDNKGDWGIALQGNGLAGHEGSFTPSASAYWPISTGDLSLDKLRGLEYGIQGSFFGAAGSYFEGFEFTSSCPFVQRVYSGASLGGSVGIPELVGGSGSIYIGGSDFLYRSDKK